MTHTVAPITTILSKEELQAAEGAIALEKRAEALASHCLIESPGDPSDLTALIARVDQVPQEIESTASKAAVIGTLAILLGVFVIGLFLIPVWHYFSSKHQNLIQEKRDLTQQIRDIYKHPHAPKETYDQFHRNAVEAGAEDLTLEQATVIYNHLSLQPTRRIRKREFGFAFAVTPLLDPTTNLPTEQYGIHLRRRLGEGAEGIVKTILTYDTTTQQFKLEATKKDIKSFDLRPERNLAHAEKRKRALLGEIENPHIEQPSTRMADLGNNRWCAVYDLAEGSYKNHAFESGQAFLQFAYDLAHALSDLHKKGVKHRDVKPDNILKNPEGWPVLIDFGLATDKNLGKSSSGTCFYMPSYEISQAGSLHTYETGQDVYGYAITLLELVYHHISKKAVDLTNEEHDALFNHHPHVFKGEMLSGDPASFQRRIASSMMSREKFEALVKKTHPDSTEEQKALLTIDSIYRKIIGKPKDSSKPITLSIDDVKDDLRRRHSAIST